MQAETSIESGVVIMTLREHLLNEYGYNEPVYVSEIEFNNYSRPWIFKELKKMVDTGVIKRFDTGVYYFPKKMPFGDSYLDSQKVITRRFLSNGSEVYGYIAGISLLNRAGLTTQVPNLIELVSNNESTRVREVRIGRQRVRVRRSRTTVTNENANTLQFLDLMNIISPSAMDETERFLLNKFIKSSGVTQAQVSKYARFYPARAMKNMIESGVAYELA